MRYLVRNTLVGRLDRESEPAARPQHARDAGERAVEVAEVVQHVAGCIDFRRKRALIVVSMQAESLEILEKAELPAGQARAIVRAIDIEIGARDTLATKQDLALLRNDLANFRIEVKGDHAGLRGELKADLARIEGKLEAKISESASSILRQMYMAILGQMAVLLGFAYFFATHLH